MLFLKFFCNSQIVQRKFLVRSKPRQILHIIGAYTMSCKQGSKRGAYIEPRENHYCALGYARANAQPKARQPTRPKGHFIDTFSFFSSFSLTKKHEPQGSCFFVVWGYGVSGKCAPFGAILCAACSQRCGWVKTHPYITTRKRAFSTNCGTHICVPYNLPEVSALPITVYFPVICREGS